jgi:hypothetical protein
MITQSTGCDFGEDNYIAIRLCCDFHHGMTKNSRNKEYYSGKMYIIVEEKNAYCLSISFFLSSFMCQY